LHDYLNTCKNSFPFFKETKGILPSKMGACLRGGSRTL
jgi:hypothetical protein